MTIPTVLWIVNVAILSLSVTMPSYSVLCWKEIIVDTLGLTELISGVRPVTDFLLNWWHNIMVRLFTDDFKMYAKFVDNANSPAGRSETWQVSSLLINVVY